MKKNVFKHESYYNNIFAVLKENDREQFRTLLLTLHERDQAEVLRRLYPENKKKIEIFLTAKEFADVLSWMDVDEQANLLKDFKPEYVREILQRMSRDDAANMLAKTGSEGKAILNQLSDQDRADLEELLAYPSQSAGSIMTKEFVSVSPNSTVHQAFNQVRAQAPTAEIIQYLYVLDAHGILLGILSIRDLFLLPAEVMIGDRMSSHFIHARLEDDQEKVARLIQDYDLVALPILDDKNILRGIVTVDDIMDIMEDEVTEDFNEFSAITTTFDRPETVWEIARARSPWIIILLFMGMLSASLISSFEETLNQVVVLAAFIPIIMDSAGNVGTQSLAVAVRGLILKEQDERIGRTIWKEFMVGMCIGLLAGIVLSLVILIFYRNAVLALILGITIFITLSLSTISGTVVPILINTLKFDPAIASGPFITTINDILGLYIYFSIASFLLHLI